MSEALNFLLAREHASRGRLKLALEYNAKHLSDFPADCDGLSLQAALLTATGEHRGALEVFGQVLLLGGASPPVFSNMGNALGALGRREEAIERYAEALEIEPAYLPALVNRAAQWMALGCYQEALDDSMRAASLDPDSAVAHRQAALALFRLDRQQEALAAIDAALAIDAAHAESHQRRAAILAALGESGPSRESLDRSRALDPMQADIALGAALGDLLRGDFHAGWRNFERRWASKNFCADSTQYAAHKIREFLSFDVDPASLAGQRVLLVDEQGVGDQIMFASIIPDLIAAAGKVSVLCDGRLRRLLGVSFPTAAVIPQSLDFAVERSDYDRFIAMGSLGRMFRNDRADFPGKPYRRPTAEALERWRVKLGPPDGRLRVGISWQGGLQRTGVGRRSMSLQQLAPILNHPGCEFFNLQYGPSAAEAKAASAWLERPIHEVGASEIADFNELAGLVLALDLIVSVQTTLVHLAGALGAPAQVMIPSEAEYRYGQSGETMPWYHSVRLHRQQSPGDWRPVLAAVGAELDRRTADGMRG